MSTIQTNFRMNNLWDMDLDLAIRIILLELNQKIREKTGNLDILTTNLFSLPIPTFVLDNIEYEEQQISIEVRYPAQKFPTHMVIDWRQLDLIKQIYSFKLSIAHNGIISKYAPNCMPINSYSRDISCDFFGRIVFMDKADINKFPNHSKLLLISMLDALFLNIFLLDRLDRFCCERDPSSRYSFNTKEFNKLIRIFKSISYENKKIENGTSRN